VQESYVTREVIDSWKKEWGGDILFSVGTAHSGGQLILIRKRLEGTVSMKICSQRILASCLEKNDQVLNIFNVCAPQSIQEKLAFFNCLQKVLDELSGTEVCVCGDFNTVLDNDLYIISGEKHP
jgi:exonuclease III